MNTDGNYPDNIHSFDTDPRSPFYDDSAEIAQDEWIDERTEQHMQDPAMVFEATGELEEDERVELARLMSEPIIAYGAIGSLIHKRVEAYLRYVAELEFDIEEPFYNDSGEY